MQNSIDARLRLWMGIASITLALSVLCAIWWSVSVIETKEARILYCTEMLTRASSLRDTVNVVNNTPFCKHWTKLP